MIRLASLWLLILAATLLFLFAIGRAVDYEQASSAKPKPAKRFKPRIGNALYCEGVPPAPVLCSLHGSRQVRWYWSSGIL